MTSSSDEFKYRCEVRFLIQLRTERGKEWLRETLMDIEKRRGKSSADRLRESIYEQWRLSNRGEWGDWRSEKGST